MVLRPGTRPAAGWAAEFLLGNGFSHLASALSETSVKSNIRQNTASDGEPEIEKVSSWPTDLESIRPEMQRCCQA